MNIAPTEKAQRKAVIVFLKIVAATILTAIATWRLGLLIGIEPEILDDLLLLGLPLVGFFFGGVVCLVVVAWLVGVLPTLLISRLNLSAKQYAMFACLFSAVAIAVGWAMHPEGRVILVVAYVAAIISLSVVLWSLSFLMWPRHFELLVWEAGVISIAMLLVLSGAFAPTRDLPILIFAAVVARIAFLFTPRLVAPIASVDPRRKRWVYGAATHGAVVSFLLLFTWFAVAPAVGWARAAVDIHLLPIMGMWLVIACLLGLLGWLVDRHMAGFACAVVFIILLWLVSAYVERVKVDDSTRGRSNSRFEGDGFRSALYAYTRAPQPDR
jgi:hypothetical protein